MSLIQRLNTISQMDNFIRRKATGTPDEFADKLGLDRATMYRRKEEMVDEMGAPIEYNRERRSFIYTEEWSRWNYHLTFRSKRLLNGSASF